jgi:hypothetical protein
VVVNFDPTQQDVMEEVHYSMAPLMVPLMAQILLVLFPELESSNCLAHFCPLD